MRVLITGGAGLIGTATTRLFLRQGWDVRVIGLETAFDMPGAEFIACDIKDYAAVRQATQGCDKVVHLAALRGPQLAPGPEIFNVNVMGTYNVFQAAVDAGIDRVVQASSINAFGCFYNLGEMDVRYLPLDEAHPIATEDPYSYSKEVIEDMGRYFWRREKVSSVAMRFPGVYEHGHIHTAEWRTRRDEMVDAIQQLAALPDDERTAQLAVIRQSAMAWRAVRPFEYKNGLPQMPQRDADHSPLWFAYAIDRFVFWTMVDVEDAAQSLYKSVIADYTGAHALFINDDQNALGIESRLLARLFFPTLPDTQIDLPGTTALISIARAQNLVGFKPAFSVAGVL